MKTVIFLGPSLDRVTAQEILPDAVLLEPAGQADLASAVHRYEPTVIGLIDGVFSQRFAVWHKEVLHALAHGIHVYGAASMGALRAAELAPFGMVGIGEVYRRFATGEFDADDEVAVLHTEADSDYRLLSTPMVNIRATLEDAAAAELITATELDEIVDIARSLHFAERHLDHILALAADRGMPPTTVGPLTEFVRDHYRDVKRADAIELLETIRDLPEDLAPVELDYEVERPHVWAAFLERDRIRDHDGVEVTDAELAYHVALHMPDFSAFNFNVLNRIVVGMFADSLGLEAEPDDIDAEERRHRLRHRLRNDDDLERWLRANDLTSDEYRDLMTEVARCRRLHKWVLIRRNFRGTTKPILDALRLESSYTDWIESFTRLESLRDEDLYAAAMRTMDETPVRDLVVDHLKSTSCRMDTYFGIWAWEAGFPGTGALVVELERARQARNNRAELIDQLGALLGDVEG